MHGIEKSKEEDIKHRSSSIMPLMNKRQSNSGKESGTLVTRLDGDDVSRPESGVQEVLPTSKGTIRGIGGNGTIPPVVSPIKTRMPPVVPAPEGQKRSALEELTAMVGVSPGDAKDDTNYPTSAVPMTDKPLGEHLDTAGTKGTTDQKHSGLEELTAVVGVSCGNAKDDSNCPSSAMPMPDKPREEHQDTAGTQGTISKVAGGERTSIATVVSPGKPTTPPVISPSKAHESSASEKKQAPFKELAAVFGPCRDLATLSRRPLHLHQLVWPDDATGDAKQVPYEATPIPEGNSKITTVPLLDDVNDRVCGLKTDSQIDEASALEQASKAKRNYQWLKDYTFSELGTPYFEAWWGKRVWLDVWGILQKQLKKLPDTEPPLHEKDWFTLAKGLALYRRSQVSDAETQLLVHQADIDEDMPTQYFMQQLDPKQEVLTFKRNPKAYPKLVPLPPGRKHIPSYPLPYYPVNSDASTAPLPASWDESTDDVSDVMGGTPCAIENAEVQCVGVAQGRFGCGTYLELSVRSQSHFEQTYAGEDDPALLGDNPGLELALRGEFVGPVYVHSPHELRCVRQANVSRPPYLKIIWFKSDEWNEDEYSKDPSNEIKPQEDKAPQRLMAASGSLQGYVAAPIQEFFDNLVSKAVHEALNKESDSTNTTKPGREEALVAPQDNAISKECSISRKKPCLEKVMVADRGKLIGICQDQATKRLQAVDEASAGIRADKGLEGQLQYMTRLLEGSHYVVDENVWRQILRIYHRSIEKAHIPMESGPRLTHSLKETWCNILRSVPKNDKPRFRLYLHDFMFHILSHLHDKDRSVPGTTPFGPVHTATAAKGPEDNDKKPAWNPKLKKRKCNESSNNWPVVPYEMRWDEWSQDSQEAPSWW